MTQKNWKIVVEGRAATSSDFFTRRNDVLAVLTTGFMKSLIFQLFVIVAEMKIKRHHTSLVLCPLQSIIGKMKIRFQRRETWEFQLHLKDGRNF